MSFDLYKKIIDECAIHNVYSIKLSWRGEPLMNPHLFEMVAYAKQKGIKDVAFLTNVEKFDDEKIKSLMSSGVDWISCSVDGLYEVYNKIRYPAKFEEIVEKVRKIKIAREQLSLPIPLIRVQTIFSAIRNDPSGFKKFWAPYADRINFIADQIRQLHNKDIPIDVDYICQSPWQRICIDYEGRVAQCHADYLEENILGDVKTQSIYEIWHGEAFKNVRLLQKTKQLHKLKPCRTCSDRGAMEKFDITIGNRKQRFLKYVGQELDLDKGKQKYE